MNIVAQTLLDASNPARSEKTEKIAPIRIKQKYGMPSFTLISVIAISFVVVFCLFSIIQINQLSNSIQNLKQQEVAVQNELSKVESEIILQQYQSDFTDSSGTVTD